MLRKYLLFIMCFLFIQKKVISQKTISGIVIDSAGKPVDNVTVSLKKTGTGGITSYTISNQKGEFRITTNIHSDSLFLSFTHVSYEPFTVQIKDKFNQLSFTLQLKRQFLKEVIVQSPPVYKQKDTINYSVSAFLSKEDRVIGDVIRKLPGIEMEGDMILYQGKPLQKFYINGIDLLEGRYSLANNNLPADAVRKIQIIENDQPIKIFDSLLFSNKASLNIQLKKYMTTGVGKLGAGLSPFLHEISITPMTFNKSFQTINSFQSNNTGNDVSTQVNQLTVGDMLDNTSFNFSANSGIFVNLQNSTLPPFEKKKWLDNNVNFVSNNFIKKLNTDTELKGDVSYVNDYQQTISGIQSLLFTASQNINIKESIRNKTNLNTVKGSLIFLKNSKKMYLKNNLQVSSSWMSAQGHVLKNDTFDIKQYLHRKNTGITNKFVAAFFLKKQLLTLNSTVGYQYSPQQLQVNPGQFYDIMNNGIPYESILQNVTHSNINTDNSISFVKNIHGFVLMPRIGIAYQYQFLYSDIDITKNNQQNILGNEFVNRLLFVYNRNYADVKMQYKLRYWRFEINTPIQYRYFRMQDSGKEMNRSLKRFTFEPSIATFYKINGFWEASATSNYTTSFGGLNTLYSSYILSTYRNLNRFAVTIPETKNWNNTVSLNYQNPLTAIFASLNYSYSKLRTNYMLKNYIDPNGSNSIEIAMQPNIQAMQLIVGHFSKYFSKLKTIIKVNQTIGNGKMNYLLNDVQGKILTKSFTTTLMLNNTTCKYLLVDYTTTLTFINSIFLEKKSEQIYTNNHVLSFGFFPTANNLLKFNAEYYITNLKTETKKIFIDFNYRHTITKRKIDIGLSCINLLNNNTYIRLYNSEFSIIQNYFQLRPRQILITAGFQIR